MEYNCINQYLRTDLAYDAYKVYGKNVPKGFKETIRFIDSIKVIKHNVTKDASNIIDKPEGTYYTIDLEGVNYHDKDMATRIEDTVSYVIKDLLSMNNLINKKCLVVGLGNDLVTPDALGPYVVDNIVVTRHLYVLDKLHSGYSVVSAISPGVMGTTGIETYDIVQSIKDKIGIDYIIVVDALCSSSISRVNRTIQFTDSGIRPGSGVLNKRKEISRSTMGIPVFAIGVPTVVDCTSIVYDTIKYTIDYLNNEYQKSDKLSRNEEILLQKEFFGKVGLLNETDQKELYKTVLTPSVPQMMVTGKDIDEQIEDLSKILAWGINKGLHASLT